MTNQKKRRDPNEPMRVKQIHHNRAREKARDRVVITSDSIG